MVVKYFYISECTSLSEWCGGAGGPRESCPSVSCGGCALINMARERERERQSGDSEQVREGTNTSVLVQFSLLPHNNTATLSSSSTTNTFTQMGVVITLWSWSLCVFLKCVETRELSVVRNIFRWSAETGPPGTGMMWGTSLGDVSAQCYRYYYITWNIFWFKKYFHISVSVSGVFQNDS